MSFDSFLRSLSFSLLSPETQAATDNRFHLTRPDGTAATLLDADRFVLEWVNTDFSPRQASKSSLEELADMPKMSTLAIGAIINNAVTCMPDDEAFVNVGVWHGYSFLAGLCGNQDKRATGIDDFSQFGGPRDEFLARFETHASPQHSFVESDYRDFFRGFSDSIGVYIYDGEHSYENQLEGLRIAEPHFADGCIIIVDDTNWRAPRKATHDFMAHSSRDYSVLLDVQTSGQHPTLWNGILVLRADSNGDVETISSIPGPKLSSTDELPEHRGTTVSALVGPGGPSAVARTQSALEDQTHPEIEILTFGEGGDTNDRANHHPTAAEAFVASGGNYVMLLDAGATPDPKAAESEVAAIKRASPARPYDWRNQRGRLRS